MKKVDAEQKLFWENKKRMTRRHPDNPVIVASVSAIVNFIKKNINPAENNSLLDVGCGNGYFTCQLAKIYDVTGLDFSKTMLEINPHHKLVHGNVESLPFKDNSFDTVFCGALLHHLKSPEKAVKEMQRVAKNYVVVCEPNRNNPLMFLFGLIRREERDSLKFTKRYLNKICEKQNLKFVKSLTSGFIYPNKTPNIKILLSFLKKLDFNQPFGNSITVIYKK